MDMGEQIKDDIVIETRKAMVASAEVAELMKTLKPWKKSLIDKGKKGKIGSATLGGQCCLPSI